LAKAPVERDLRARWQNGAAAPPNFSIAIALSIAAATYSAPWERPLHPQPFS